MAKRLLTLTSVACMLVSLWLLGVLLWVLPRVNPETIPFWLGTMIGFFVIGAGSLFMVRFPALPPAIRIASGFAAGIAGLFGLLGLFQNEIQARRGGDWEGYISLIALVAIAHAIAVFAFLLEFWRQKALR